ncbi:hypothetical protein E3E12_01725 [Formicincola oecophyllae]|uniref:VWA domain-containing protein n=1 Tax=Formicincola oecophyllae TaxID=2558361 RepID=A0A4Y6UAG6_9PROT|nr:hypothetical protein [Formicincola oecophyllae]QDH13125.1 hypothetical protein E3E12_01725 [Formicincola oecophyllae]
MTNLLSGGHEASKAIFTVMPHPLPHLVWHPSMPWWVIGTLGACAASLALLGLVQRQRGTLPVALALGVGLLWLAGPGISTPLKGVRPRTVAVLVDQSPSMALGQRRQQARKAVASLQASARSLADVTVRVVPFGAEGPSTKLLPALAQVQRWPDLAASVIVSDGQATDATPQSALSLATSPAAPLSLIVAGQKGETDRSLTLTGLPPYVVAGEKATLTARADDHGATTSAPVTWRLRMADGTVREVAHSRTGEPTTITLPLGPGGLKAGTTPVEISVSPRPGEVSSANNHRVIKLVAVRNRLRVVLVSGSPQQSTRVWRRLLKSDSTVDLVHFTILRAPEMEDDALPSELALIPFPTKTLFKDKLRSFDLVILDRFATQGLLPDAYMQNMADYVKGGGALLVTTGPEQLEGGALEETPLASVLPARLLPAPGVPMPSPQVGPYSIVPTERGRHHPITSALGGAGQWGPWYRMMRPLQTTGEVLLEARPQSNLPTTPSEGDSRTTQPALIIGQAGKGRVAMMMSGQSWLWSRPLDRSGPQMQLLDRLAHWLMKEPSLEENRLTATMTRGAGGKVVLAATRVLEKPAARATVQVNGPEGQHLTLVLQPPAGQEQATVLSGQLTLPANTEPEELWCLKLDGLSATAWLPSQDQAENRDLHSTAGVLGPLVAKTGGHIVWGAGKATLLEGSAKGGIPVGGRMAMLPGQFSWHALLPLWAVLALMAGLLGVGWRRASE